MKKKKEGGGVLFVILPAGLKRKAKLTTLGGWRFPHATFNPGGKDPNHFGVGNLTVKQHINLFNKGKLKK